MEKIEPAGTKSGTPAGTGGNCDALRGPPAKRPRTWAEEPGDVALAGIAGSTANTDDGSGECEKAHDGASGVAAESLCSLVSVNPVDAREKAVEAEVFAKFVRGEYLVDMDKVSIEESAGNGTFGQVYRAEYKGRSVAVKMFKNKELMRRLVQEIYVLAKMRHPNIVGFVGVGWKRESDDREWEPALFMEYCSMGSLFQILYSPQELKRFSRGVDLSGLLDENTRKIALGVAKALGFVHSLGYSHLDLCSTNVLLTETMEPKLADFGQTRGVFGIGAPNVGHMQYRAPELCFTKSKNYMKLGHYSEKADVYSYAILLWEIFHKEIPWSGVDDVLKKVKEGKRPKVNKEIVQKPWRKLLKMCWAGDPAKRISASEIVEWIKGIPCAPQP